MVLKELAASGFASIGDYLEWFGDTVTLRDSAELTPEQMRVVAEVSEVVTAGGAKTIKIKLHDKQTALEKLAKHLGMYIDRTEITGKDGGPALVTLADLRKRAFVERQASAGGSTDATS